MFTHAKCYTVGLAMAPASTGGPYFASGTETRTRPGIAEDSDGTGLPPWTA